MTAVLQASPQPRGLERRRALEHAVFGVLPALVTGWLLLYVLTTRFGAVDFRQDFWTAGWRLLHGNDLYAWSRTQITAGASFPYPALAALLFVPFALIPTSASAVLFTVLCLAAVVGVLRTGSVRDWRLYGVVALWPAVVSGWQTANVTLLLLLGIICVWRYRDRPLVAAALVALLVSFKPIVFPLGIWLIATRRYAAAGYALLIGLAVNVVAWSIIGWGAIGGWLHLISVQGELLYRKGYAVVALAADIGLSRHTGTLLEIAFGLIIAALCVWAGRRRLEVVAFALATLLMLEASPQVDLHYFALLIAPLIIVRPRLHWSWLLPLVLWLCPASAASGWQAALWWLVAALVLGDMIRYARPAVPVKTATASLA